MATEESTAALVKRAQDGDRDAFQELIERYRDAGAQPPSVKQCQKEAASNQQSVPQLLGLAAADGGVLHSVFGVGRLEGRDERLEKAAVLH